MACSEVLVPAARFVALYLFDRDGRLTDSKIGSFGPRQTIDGKARQDLLDRRLRELGPVVFDRIEIAPFAIERSGVASGLIVHEPEELIRHPLCRRSLVGLGFPRSRVPHAALAVPEMVIRLLPARSR